MPLRMMVRNAVPMRPALGPPRCTSSGGVPRAAAVNDIFAVDCFVAGVVHEWRAAPALGGVLAGAAVLSRGQRGVEIAELQERLNDAGARPPLVVDGRFGARTEAAVVTLQARLGLSDDGVVGTALLTRLFDGAASRAIDERRCTILASGARAVGMRRDTVGWCARGVGDALEAIGVFERVPEAFLYAERLAARADFRELPSSTKLARLPPGTIVVWGRNAQHPHGHVAVTLGRGFEASDHVQALRLGDYGSDFGASSSSGARVRLFVPVVA